MVRAEDLCRKKGSVKSSKVFNTDFFAGINFLKNLEQTESFKSIGAKISRRIHPLCKEYTWGTDDYWSCFIRQDAFTVYHPTTTCKMGPVSDKETVVDPRLR